MEPRQKKKKTAKPEVPTGTILDVAEFDLASQQTTKEDKMLKDKVYFACSAKDGERNRAPFKGT